MAAAGLAAVYLSLDSPERPWRAVVIGSLILAIFAVGYLDGGWRGIVLAIAFVAAAFAADDVMSTSGVPEDPTCERFCGISLTGFLIITLPLVALVSAAGVGARALARSLRP